LFNYLLPPDFEDRDPPLELPEDLDGLEDLVLPLEPELLDGDLDGELLEYPELLDGDLEEDPPV